VDDRQFINYQNMVDQKNFFLFSPWSTIKAFQKLTSAYTRCSQKDWSYPRS